MDPNSADDEDEYYEPDNGNNNDNANPFPDAADSVVLEEEIDPNYVPSDPEVFEYARWLGMDLTNDYDLVWIAREGLRAPLPLDWKPCKTKDTDDIYYFNFSTGDSTWDHPCDGYYKHLYEEEKKKKETVLKVSVFFVCFSVQLDGSHLLFVLQCTGEWGSKSLQGETRRRTTVRQTRKTKS